MVIALLAAACTWPMDADGGFAFAGSWSYEGVQEIPSALEFTGPVSLAAAGDPTDFEGTVALTETTPLGAVRLLSGPLSGLVVDDSILDFTVQLAGAARRHVGIARGDSVVGTWADGGGSVASGRFTLRRVGTP
jgi:hypothetical protein